MSINWDFFSNKDKQNKAVLLIFGVFWIVVGANTIYEPVYYFRGSYVDFTGHNIEVGVGLMLVGLAFIWAWLKKPKSSK